MTLLFSRETSNVAFINEVEVDGDVTVYFVCVVVAFK